MPPVALQVTASEPSPARTIASPAIWVPSVETVRIRPNEVVFVGGVRICISIAASGATESIRIKIVRMTW